MVKWLFVGSDQSGVKGLERARKTQHLQFLYWNNRPFIQAYRRDPTHFALPVDFDFSEIVAKQHLFSRRCPPGSGPGIFSCTRARRRKTDCYLKWTPMAHWICWCWAGFMRNLTPYFIDRFNTDPDQPRIMNIHPAILPSFPGVDGYGGHLPLRMQGGGVQRFILSIMGKTRAPSSANEPFPFWKPTTLDGR